MSLGLVRRVPDKGEPNYQFNHGVTREVMYRQMAFAQRRRLHELAAKAFEARQPRPADAILGHHWSKAEIEHRALPYWQRAGYAAFAAGAWAEAAASLDQALACLSGMPEGVGRATRTARLYRHAGNAHLQIGNIARSRQYLVEALAALRRTWPKGNLQTMSALSKEMAQQFLIEFAPRLFGGGTAALEPELEAAQIYESLGQVLGHFSELNLMGLATLAALNISQRCGNKQIYSRACGLFALALLLIPVPTMARRYFRHSIDTRPARSQPHDWLMTTEYLVLYCMTVADFDVAESELLEMLEVGRAANNRRRCLDAMSLLSITLMCKGELDRCTEILAVFETEVLNERDPQVRCWAHLEQAELALMRGDVESALRQVDGCADLLQTLGRNERLWGEGLRALALWRRSQTDDALAAASRVLCLLRNSKDIAFYAEGGVFAAAEVYIQALRAIRQTDRGRAIVTEARYMMRCLHRYGIRLPICRPRTLMLLGSYQTILGCQRGGANLLHSAREEAARQKRPYEEALAVVQIAAADSTEGSKVEGALRSLRAMGAERLLEYLPVARSVL
jgi:tetratricopeptide (TPR) repeat protein